MAFYLQKAHIEQQSAGAENVAQLERIVTDIARNESIIARAESKIQKLDSADEAEDDGIQAKIDKEQQRISLQRMMQCFIIEDSRSNYFCTKAKPFDAQKR